MRRLATAVVVASIAAGAQAAPLPQGVYRGTIGTLPVHLCMGLRGADANGAYYYDRVGKAIPLQPSGNAFVEGHDPDDAKAPRLRIDSTLKGSWSSGKSTLPVQLTRVKIGPVADELGPCGAMEFQSPRLRPPTIKRQAQQHMGHKITVLTFKPAGFESISMQSFQLDRAGAGVAKVNALLAAAMPSRLPRVGDMWLDCVRFANDANGNDGDYDETIEPAVISSRWMSVSENSGSYCGGAHPESSLQFRNFDLEKGVEVDLLDWFGPKAVKVEKYDGEASKTLTPAFRAAILKGWKTQGDAECQSVVGDAEYWSVGIGPGKLMFQPSLPHVAQACGETFVVEHARVAPWMTPAGKALLATLP